MADIDYDYDAASSPALVDGQLLQLDGNGLNKDLHSTTSGKSLYGEINGGIAWANVASGQKIDAAHLHRDAASECQAQGLLRSVDHFDECFLDSAEQALFVPISGCGIKRHFAYPSGMVLWQWHLFVSVWRLRERVDDYTLRDPPDILIKAFRGTTAIGATTRNMPETIVQHEDDDVYSGPGEHLMTRHFCMSYMETNLAAGVHDLWVGVYVERQQGTEFVKLPFLRGNEQELSSNDRFTVGIRGASVVALV